MASNAKNLAELLNQDSTIAAGDVAAGSITEDKLAANAVTSGKIAANAVITAKVADGAVTAVKTTGVGKAKNLIGNGAMQVAQRGTSSTGTGYVVCDRFKTNKNGPDLTTTQHDLSTTDTPYSLGFRHSYQVHVTDPQTPDAAADYAEIETRIEARNMATCGWNYTSASSKITLSFWVLSTVAGTYSVMLRALDNASSGVTNATYSFDYTVSANTWTKVTHTIPGHANLVFNNDNGPGLVIYFTVYYGTNYTGTRTDEAWIDHVGSNSVGDYAQNLLATDEAKFEITGVQLEVGDTASDFEHLTFAEHLFLCHRYCRTYDGQNFGRARDGDSFFGGGLHFNPPMRATPTLKSGATFVVNTGNAGTPGINSGQGPSADSIQLYNSGSSWTANSFPKLTGIFEAEL